MAATDPDHLLKAVDGKRKACVAVRNIVAEKKKAGDSAGAIAALNAQMVRPIAVAHGPILGAQCSAVSELAGCYSRAPAEPSLYPSCRYERLTARPPDNALKLECSMAPSAFSVGALVKVKVAGLAPGGATFAVVSVADRYIECEQVEPTDVAARRTFLCSELDLASVDPAPRVSDESSRRSQSLT